MVAIRIRSGPGRRRRQPQPQPGVFARLGATLVFGAFLGVGLFFLVLVGQQTWQQLEPHRWRTEPATMLRSEVVRRGAEQKPYLPVVVFRYEWNGETRTGDVLSPGDLASDSYTKLARRLAPYPVEAQVRCRVAPDGRAVLEPGRPWLALFLLLPLAFVVIGGVGLVATWRRGQRDAQGRPLEGSISEAAGRRRGARAMLASGAGLATIGAAIGWPLALDPALSVWRARDWRAQTCVVEHASVVSHRGDDGTTYSVDILYRWQQGEQTHRSNRYAFWGGSSGGREGKQAIVRAHPVGSRLTCWVDPEHPGEAVIERGLTPHAFVALFPLALVAFGLALAVAARRRLARRERLGQMLAGGGAGPAPDDPVLEWLPDFSLSPGRRPLRPGSTRAGRLAGIVFACLFWNGIVAVFARQALESFERGRPEWGLTLFLVPFLLIGVGIALAVVHALLGLTNARPRVEANASALALGETLEIDWRMLGRLAGLRRLSIVLEGHEKATYRRGTNSHTAQELFASLQLVDRADPQGMAGGQASLRIPRDTMHSFVAGNNEIAWSLHLKGEIHRWPDVEERYPIVLLPLPRGTSVKPEDAS